MRRTLVAILFVVSLLTPAYASAQNAPPTWCPAMDPLIDKLQAMQTSSQATGAAGTEEDCKAYSELTGVLNQIVSTLETCKRQGGVGLDPTIQEFTTIRSRTLASRAGCT